MSQGDSLMLLININFKSEMHELFQRLGSELRTTAAGDF